MTASTGEMVGMPQHERSHTRRALAVIGLGLALVVAILLVGVNALQPGGPRLAAAPTGTPAASRTVAGPARPATMPSETDLSRTGEPKYGGADAQQEEFYEWAAQHQVGSLNLPGMDSATGQLAEVANGYCDLLSDEPGGSGEKVTLVIRMQTGATRSMSQELLERSVAAFCPQKARHLV